MLRKEEHSMLAEFLDDKCKENLVLTTNYYPMVCVNDIKLIVTYSSLHTN